MKRIISGVLVGVLAACSQPKDQRHATVFNKLSAENSAAGPEEREDTKMTNLLAMLAKGDRQVCGHDFVQQLVVKTMARTQKGLEPFYDTMISQGMRFTFEAVSMTGRNLDISEVTCSANISTPAGAIPTVYMVRPGVSVAPFVVQWTTKLSNRMVGSMVYSEINKQLEAAGFDTPRAAFLREYAVPAPMPDTDAESELLRSNEGQSPEMNNAE